MILNRTEKIHFYPPPPPPFLPHPSPGNLWTAASLSMAKTLHMSRGQERAEDVIALRAFSMKNSRFAWMDGRMDVQKEERNEGREWVEEERVEGEERRWRGRQWRRREWRGWVEEESVEGEERWWRRRQWRRRVWRGGRRDGGEGESEGGRDCGADKMCVLTMLTSLLSASVSFVESISHCLRASNICKYMYIVQIIYTFIICTHNIHIMY